MITLEHRLLWPVAGQALGEPQGPHQESGRTGRRWCPVSVEPRVLFQSPTGQARGHAAADFWGRWLPSCTLPVSLQLPFISKINSIMINVKSCSIHAQNHCFCSSQGNRMQPQGDLLQAMGQAAGAMPSPSGQMEGLGIGGPTQQTSPRSRSRHCAHTMVSISCGTFFFPL